MSYEKVSTILKDGDARRYGVAAFNCHNFESINTVIRGAEEQRMPVIVMLYPSVRQHIPMSTFAAITIDLAKRAKVPVGLHLDHCNDFDLMMQAIRDGFTSLIVDASMLPYEENVRLTREVVKVARPMGIDVEAEIGFVGRGENAADYVDSSKYTTPELAKKFEEDTELTSMAVAIGNGHGHYAVEPKLDIARLAEIDKVVEAPLVLHGGSGIPDDQLVDSVQNGMVKFNFGTNFGGAITAGMVDFVNSKPQRLHAMGIIAAGDRAGLEFVKDRIRVLNPNNVTV